MEEENQDQKDEATQILSSLFTKNGLLSPPRYFQKLGYKWKISTKFTNLHNVPAVDLKVECLDLEPEKFLSMMVIFKNNTHIEKHSFWHVFDANRRSFCYRRVATGVRTVRPDGVTVVNFPIDRFMKDREVGEVYDSALQKCWPIYVPVTWSVMENGEIEAGTVKKCYFFFDYSITLRHIVTLTTLPNRFHLPAWPKCNRFPVNLEFFEPIWPRIADFLEGMHEEPMTSDKCWQICDVLGVLYHQWKFDESTMLKLEDVADEIGMQRFWEGVGFDGDFFKMTSSASSVDIVKDQRERHIETKIDDVKHNVFWRLRRVPSVLKVFTGGFQCTINFFQSTFRDAEYLSAGIVLLGDVDFELECTIEMTFGEGEKSIRSRAQRHLTRKQNTIQVPIVCELEQIPLGELCKVEVLLEQEYKRVEHKEQFNMPGRNDVELRFGDKSVRVSRTFLGHHCQFFRTMFFNTNFVEHARDVLEITSASHSDFLHFLDALYHEVKVFRVSEYYDVLRMADEWICDKVIAIVEKGLAKCRVESVNREKLAKKFNLKRIEEDDAPETKKRRVN